MINITDYQKMSMEHLIENHQGMTLGELLREAREIYGLKRKTVTEMAGIKEMALYFLEIGQTWPKREYVVPLMDLYQLPKALVFKKMDEYNSLRLENRYRTLSEKIKNKRDKTRVKIKKIAPPCPSKEFGFMSEADVKRFYSKKKSA